MELFNHLISWRPFLTREDYLLIKLQVLGYIPNVLEAFGVIVAGFIIYKLTARPFRKLLLRGSIDKAFVHIIVDNIYKVIVIIITVVTAVGQLGINIVAALTGIGILGIAIGFAAQDSLSNIVAGFLIFLDKPFRVGDYITLGKYYGRVEVITMRSTRIRTQDNTYVVIPNQKIINDVVVDHTTNGETRINVSVTIPHEESVDKAREAILGEVGKIEGVLETPAPDVVLNNLADMGSELLVRVWIENTSIERRVFFKTTETTKRALHDAGIEIARPVFAFAGGNDVQGDSGN